MKKAYISAIAYSFLIGFSFLATKVTVTEAGPIIVLAHRFLIGSLVFVIYRMFSKTKSSIKIQDLKVLLPLSITYPILYFLVQAIALNKISSGEVGIIFAGAPAITLIIASVFIKEKSTLLQKSGILLSMIGVILIFTAQGVEIDSSLLSGYIFAVIAAVVFAVYNTHAKVVLKKYKFIDVTEFLLIVGAILYNVLAVFNSGSYFTPFGNPDYIIGILYIGIFASVFASLTATYALTVIKASQLTIFTNLATLISILAGVVVLGESIYWYHYTSTILIIIGVMLSNGFIKVKTKVK